MRKLIVLGSLFLTMSMGCKKFTETTDPEDNPTPAKTFSDHKKVYKNSPDGPNVHAPTGFVTGGIGGGGSGGAVQAVRKAVVRTVTLNEMNNLKLFLNEASLATGTMPDRQTIYDSVLRADPKLAELIRDQVIILTGIPQREGVWAYEVSALQTQGKVLTHNGIETWNAQQLRNALMNQPMGR